MLVQHWLSGPILSRRRVNESSEAHSESPSHVRYLFTTGKGDMKALSTRRRTRASLTRYDMAFLLEALGYGEAVSYLDNVSTS